MQQTQQTQCVLSPSQAKLVAADGQAADQPATKSSEAHRATGHSSAGHKESEQLWQRSPTKLILIKR
jgi:hypothetical protein